MKEICILGVTGGVGAGKSTVLEILRTDFNAYIISCDEVARKLQLRGGSCFADIVNLFGESILLPDGELDRKRIAELVFNDPALLRSLEHIVHPAVRQKILSMAKEAGHRLTVIESALLLQAGYDEICCQIWYVYASEQVRRERLRRSRDYSDERISRMFASQETPEWYRNHTDYVIDNDTADISGLKKQIEKGLRDNGFLHNSQRQQR